MEKLKRHGRSKGAGALNFSIDSAENRTTYTHLIEKMRVSDRKRADALVRKYVQNLFVLKAIGRAIFELLTADQSLSSLAHSIKYRIKDPEHLRLKLYLKCVKAKAGKVPFTVDDNNFYQKINDLIGIRILHLYTNQIVEINAALDACLSKENYLRLEGPIAKTWDDEYRRLFASLGIETEASVTQYTSIHYVYDAQTDARATFEVQVRTLAEELWGEVDRRINYPEGHGSIACTEQISVLARVTSGCTRLVDAIFRTHVDYISSKVSPSAPQRSHTKGKRVLDTAKGAD